MKTRFFLPLALCFFFIGCDSNDDSSPAIPETSSVLILRVDYTTNTFEAGTELFFGTNSDFTVTNEYEAQADFGSVKLFWDQQDELLFNGEIHWNGTGALLFPQTFLPQSEFEYVDIFDFVTPASGFENVFNPGNETYDYEMQWGAVQPLVKVRQYLEANPTQTAKIFLYTPSVGIGNPEEWDWYFILKK